MSTFHVIAGTLLFIQYAVFATLIFCLVTNRRGPFY